MVEEIPRCEAGEGDGLRFVYAGVLSRSRLRSEKGLERSTLWRMSAPVLVPVRRGEVGRLGRGVSGRLMPGCSIQREGERQFGEMGGGRWRDRDGDGEGERRRRVFVWGRRRSAEWMLVLLSRCDVEGRGGSGGACAFVDGWVGTGDCVDVRTPCSVLSCVPMSCISVSARWLFGRERRPWALPLRWATILIFSASFILKRISSSILWSFSRRERISASFFAVTIAAALALALLFCREAAMGS